MRLTVTPRHGLVVVVPTGWGGDAEAMVASHAEWAHRALGSIADKRELHLAGESALLPQTVELHISGESLAVEIRPSEGRSQARRVGDRVVISGPGNASAQLEALSRWLDREARALLLPRFEALCREAGVEHAGVRVRANRSRWGSCTARRTISLGRNLVFLAPELVDAVMFHEIAHLSELNHSPRFYARLERLDPQWRRHRELLRAAGSAVPAWAER